MKILHAVESYFPSVGGMQEVVRQLSERMVKQGHDVTVVTRSHPGRTFTNYNGVLIVGFNVSGNLVNGLEGDVDAYRQWLLSSDFDVLTFFAAQQWATDIALPLLPEIKGRKVFVPTGYSALYDPEYSGYFKSMKSWLRGFDMSVYLSENYRDIVFARELGLKNLQVIPNGASETEFSQKLRVNVRERLGLPSNRLLVLHVGSFTGLKGHAETLQIFLKARIKKASLLMIGNDIAGFRSGHMSGIWSRFQRALQFLLHGKQVFAGDFDRQFTVAAYQQADVFLFPSNIECSPLVLFESCAAGLPFLTTKCGNAEEIISWTGGGELLPCETSTDGFTRANISGSAAALEQLANDPARRVRLGKSGRAAWLERYTWEKIAGDYLALYKSLIN